MMESDTWKAAEFTASTRWMLKAPPLFPQTYISRSFKIDSTEGHKYVQKYVRKSSKKRKKVVNGICPIIVTPLHCCLFCSESVCVYILFTSQFDPWLEWELLLCFSYPLCSG